jgi:hypothetical protein
MSTSGVISDRTGFELRPVDGSLCLIGAYARDIDLPGLRIRVRKGPPRLDGDQDFMDGLVLASEPRRFLENLRPSRTRRAFHASCPQQRSRTGWSEFLWLEAKAP